MPSSPAISVLMPVYNEKSAYLAAAIESVLAQTFKDFELLIVDDGSTDLGTLETIQRFEQKDFRIHLIRSQRNRGLPHALNQGLKKARAPYIARLDSDDLARADRLRVQHHFMQKNPEYVLCGSWVRLIDGQGQKIGVKKGFTDYAAIKENIFKFNFFTHSSWFFRRAIIQKLGGYSDQFPLNEDYDLLLRLIQSYRVQILPRLLVSYRVNAASLTQKQTRLAQKTSLRLRWHALNQYHYPKRYYLTLLAAFLFYALPLPLQKLITQRVLSR